MDFKPKKAIYLQIVDFICEKILQKHWAAHEKIPSIRELATMLEVNPNTITRTYAFLEEKNIITKQRGIGYFVAKNAWQKTSSLKKQEFFEQELPFIFKNMKLLNIDMQEIQHLFNKEKS